MTQLALSLRFDAKAAKRAKDEAIARVEANSNSEWLDAAERVVMIVAAKFPVGGFCSDDVWNELALRKVEAPHIKDALGAVMNRLRKADLIKCTGEYRASERPESHGQPKRVWRRA